MAAPTEQIAIWILMALKEEWDRDPSLLTCRTESVVLGPLKAKHKIEDGEIVRGIRFLVNGHMLKAVNRSDGRASFPSDRGLDYSAAFFAAQTQEASREQDVRLKKCNIAITVAGIAVAILGLVVAYLTYVRRK